MREIVIHECCPEIANNDAVRLIAEILPQLSSGWKVITTHVISIENALFDKTITITSISAGPEISDEEYIWAMMKWGKK